MRNIYPGIPPNSLQILLCTFWEFNCILIALPETAITPKVRPPLTSFLSTKRQCRVYCWDTETSHTSIPFGRYSKILLHQSTIWRKFHFSSIAYLYFHMRTKTLQAWALVMTLVLKDPNPRGSPMTIFIELLCSSWDSAYPYSTSSVFLVPRALSLLLTFVCMAYIMTRILTYTLTWLDKNLWTHAHT